MNIRLALTGDLLVRETISQAARQGNEDSYCFDSLLAAVAPYLRDADLTIGNLEVPLAGREERYLKRNPLNRYPQFNCPDELAPALKDAGFQVLTTANNHCLDRGTAGLRRTLRVLDEYGLKHTGTYAKRNNAGSPAIVNVKGIRIGILSYTRGTNAIACPYDWMVNKMKVSRIREDLQALKRKADYCIVALHHGPEYSCTPTQGQKKWARMLQRWGADLVLGSHPHVVQPMTHGKDGKLAIYSLGSLVSSRLKKNPLTLAGVILLLELKQHKNGKLIIGQIQPIPTWVHKSMDNEAIHYEVVPLQEALEDNNRSFPPEELKDMRQALNHILSMMG